MRIWIQKDLKTFFACSSGNFNSDFFRRGSLEDAQKVDEAATALAWYNGFYNGFYYPTYEIRNNDIYFYIGLD